MYRIGRKDYQNELRRVRDNIRLCVQRISEAHTRQLGGIASPYYGRNNVTVIMQFESQLEGNREWLNTLFNKCEVSEIYNNCEVCSSHDCVTCPDRDEHKPLDVLLNSIENWDRHLRLFKRSRLKECMMSDYKVLIDSFASAFRKGMR